MIFISRGHGGGFEVDDVDAHLNFVIVRVMYHIQCIGYREKRQKKEQNYIIFTQTKNMIIFAILCESLFWKPIICFSEVQTCVVSFTHKQQTFSVFLYFYRIFFLPLLCFYWSRKWDWLTINIIIFIRFWWQLVGCLVTHRHVFVCVWSGE